MSRTRDNQTNALSPEAERVLTLIADDTDATDYDEDDRRTLTDLCVAGYVYTTRNDEAGTLHAHLKDRGRDALGIPRYGAEAA